MPTANVSISRALLADLASRAGHREVLVDPVDQIRRGVLPASRAVTYRCADDCPACTAQAILTSKE